MPWRLNYLCVQFSQLFLIQVCLFVYPGFVTKLVEEKIGDYDRKDIK